MSPSFKFLAIKNYRKHQHYHKRGAPWIKLYAATLTDAPFVQLPEAAQAQLMKLWLLASQFGHPLPNNPKLLAGKIGTTGRFYLAALVDAGFLIPCNEEPMEMLADDTENASKDLSQTEQHASTTSGTTRRVPALAREVELELENRTSSVAWRPSLEPALAARLTTDADRNALTAVLAKAPNRLAWCAELNAMLDGMPGHQTATPEQLGEALRDFVANGGALGQPNIRHFRSYVERIVKQPPQVHPREGSKAPGSGRAAMLFAQIRQMIQTSQQPGHGAVRFIKKADVQALGHDVFRAYEGVGGADRFIAATGEQVSFLLRDFTAALDAARDAA